MNENQQTKKQRIGTSEAIILIIFAAFFDLLSLIPFLNIVIVFVAQGLLSLFFYFHGVGVFSKKKAVTMTIGTLAEVVPFVSMLPALTAQTLVIIFMTRTEDKLGVSIPSVKPSIVPKK